MPYFWKTKTLLVKIEGGGYGVDPVPTGAANAVLAIDVTLSPMEGEDVDRNLEQPKMGASPSMPAGVYAKLTFSVEAASSGALGTAPAYGPLLRMCSVAETVTAATKVEYTPVTGGPESGAIYFAIGDGLGNAVRHVILGARGTCVFRLNAQGIPMWMFTISGLFTIPTTVAAVSPTLTGFKAPMIASKANTPTFTIGGTGFTLRDFEFDMGVDVQMRMLVGQEVAMVVDKKESLKATVEAVALATYDPFTSATAQTQRAIQLVHGVGAGKVLQLDFPVTTQKRLTGYQQPQNIVEWPLEFVPLQNAGDDQWKLTIR
ncbi:MAG: hypothetical protein IT472_08830 [Thermomonas sp.]|uniref:hypothetical protein n=1 Tax=Thermomonas sp. TaxID=1971895 RepID=UPI00262980FC|nr:hypothetical protein [Thermomonas sp.]MCC7097269.1 hypothetical protein [Thermomonas sp.]